MFKLPDLPSVFYHTLKQTRVHYRLSPWQAVLLAIATLSDAMDANPARVSTLAEDLKARYPQEYIPPATRT